MSKRAFVLTERDQKILYFLFRFKTASLEDIHQEVFKNVHYSAVTRRLRKLELAKLVRRDVIFDEEKRCISLFSLSLLGLSKLKVSGHDVMRKQIRSNFLTHDLKLVKIATVLKKFEMVDQVITENELLGLDLFQKDESLLEFIDLKPDGVLKLNVKGHPFFVALEYELNAKSVSRWKEKLGQYYGSGGIDAVFYLCETASMMKKLIEIDGEMAREQRRKVFFCPVKKVESEVQRVTFVNSQGAEFILL